MQEPSQEKRGLFKIDSVPSMPHIVNEVMGLIADPNSNAARVGQAIGKDQALVARILQVANSPFYGRPRKVTAIRDAIVLLGLASVKGLVVASGARYLMKNPGLLENLLWDHSLGGAFAAHEVARVTGRMSPDEAFTAGLLHDITRMVMAMVDRERYVLVTKALYNDNLPPGSVLELEREHFGYTHTEIALTIAEKWRLGNILLAAMEGHHIDPAGPRGRFDQSPMADVRAVTCMANLILYRLGIGIRAPISEIDLAGHFVARHLGLSPEALHAMARKVLLAFREQKQTHGQF